MPCLKKSCYTANMRTLIGGKFMYNYGNFVNPGYSDYTPDLRQRLNNMQMQQNMRQQPMPQQFIPPYNTPQSTNNGITTIPVTCIEEAKAARIALDGSVTVFLDIQNNCIYTKQLNNNGIAELVIYQKVPENVQQQPQYVGMQDFQALQSRIEQLEQKLKATGGKGNVSKSNAISESSTK